MVVQPDGKIVVGGYFTALAGQPRNLIGRLNADGSLDTSFDGGTNFAGYSVYSLAIQSDGKILVGGAFTTLHGASGIIRLFADGTIDTSFSSGLAGSVADTWALCIQTDDRVLVGGYFTAMDGQPHTDLGRLNVDGTADSAFNPSAQVGVNSLAIQPDNNILVGGDFKQLNGQPRNGIGRLTQDGQLDTNFNPAISGTVFPIALQADGKILLGGMFSGSSNGFDHMRRLSSEGIVDTNFNSEPYSDINSIAVQVDGGILVAGEFDLLGGQARTDFGRLNADGSPDPSANAEVSSNSFINCVTIQPDGSILLGGWFSSVAGQPRQNLARLESAGSSIQKLTFDGARIEWRRSGPLPECWNVKFAFSTNNSDWVFLGAAQRVTDGWQLAREQFVSNDLSTNSTLRARGSVPSGASNGSEWFVEQSVSVNPFTPPIILGKSLVWGGGSNQLQFDFTALIGQNIVVEISSNLNHWVPIATNLVTKVPCHFNAEDVSGRMDQFCRLRLR
jgi:uncharacterized delta-60 repeat protein